MPTPKLRYALYARKSSESEERQLQSIDDQLKVMTELAKAKDMEVVEHYTEAKSAKTPERRKEFTRMLEDIKRGQVQGIICWKLDRLARNPDEAGKILGMLQRGQIRHIRTHERDYFSEDNALISYLEFGFSDQYSRDLSKNVKRGQQSKLEKGWRPGAAPLGYLNTKTEARGENYLVVDEERFPLLRRAWDLMLTGRYVPEEIRDKLNDEWGFRTRSGRKKVSKPVARSTLYRIFSNPFYAGVIEFAGKQFPGKHTPMVSLEEFELVQVLLGRKGRPHPAKNTYAYAGLMHCGQCGGLISGTRVRKALKSTGKVKEYDFYYCHDARKHPDRCSQGLYTSSEDIDAQIADIVGSFTIAPEFTQWALVVIADQAQEEGHAIKTAVEQKQAAIVSVEQQLTSLTRMRIQELVTDAEYLSEKSRLQTELTALKVKQGQVEMDVVDDLGLTAAAFEFARDAQAALANGSMETKRAILSALGSNQTLKDHKVSARLADWLLPIASRRELVNATFTQLEPTKDGSITGKVAGFSDDFSTMRE